MGRIANMIGPLKLIASCVALLLVSILLVALSSGPVEAGPDGGPVPGDGPMPAPHEWVMIVLLFALVITHHHCRASNQHHNS